VREAESRRRGQVSNLPLLDTGFRRYDDEDQNELFNALLGQNCRVRSRTIPSIPPAGMMDVQHLSIEFVR
jgi:hypothetical protein